MPTALVTAAPGPAAARALAEQVAALKGADPLAPVSVLVRAEDAAVHLRRALARAAGGVAAVEALPLDRLARTVLAATGTGVRSASRPVLAAALRRAAHQGDRALAASADQQATQDALVATYHELTALGDAGLAAAQARPGLGGSVARIAAAARRTLAANGWADDAVLLARAAEALVTGAVPAPGPVVAFRTEPPTPAEALLLDAVGRVGTLVVVDATGPLPSPRSLVLAEATDPDEEVRAAVRRVAGALAAGVPADRVALAFTVDQPYRRIAAELLDEAGIGWNGSAAGSLLESPAGRVVRTAAAERPGGEPWRAVADALAARAQAEPPDDERTRAVVRLVHQLAALDALGPPPAPAAVVETLHAELAAVLPRVGRVGRGVTVGTLRRVADGAPWRLVVVVGAAEGWAPSGSTGASLLTDADRRALGVPTAAELDARQLARLRAVLAEADEAVVTWPAADLRRTSRRSPSRWLTGLRAEVAGAGRPVVAETLPTAFGAVARHPSPLWRDHRRRRALAEPARLADEDAAFATGWAALQARLHPAPTAYDGLLTGEDLGFLRFGEQPVGPTVLERYAGCGRTYFTRHVLGVDEARAFDELTGADAVTDGTIVHRVLERAVVREEELGRRLTRAEQATLVADALDEVAPQLQRVPELLRRQHRRGHLARLWRALDHDAEDRATGRTPEAVEVRFGGRDRPFSLTLPDGRRVAFHGSIDRVDRQPDGSLVVLDYKSGGSVRRGSDDDPLLGGTVLQLAVYALAAEERFGAPVERVEYRIVGRDKVTRSGGEAAGAIAALGATVADLVAGIEHGVFLPGAHAGRQPGRPTCWVCDPHGLLARQHARRRRVLTAALVAAAAAAEPGDGGG